ncbi:MAG: hypothetical protein J6J38_07780 [Lachnospiraceae bacterium]|nr:hypothetical protein [Lachnospiraceae bacterium]
MAEFEQIYTDKQRKTKIKKEQKRLEDILKNIDTSKKKTVEKLIEDAAFMAVTLEETRQIIARDGVIEVYQNGENQKGIKKSSAVEVYDKMLNTYSKVIKQLCDLIPERVIFEPDNEDEDPAEELMAFVNGFKR